jgi:hypothetical protein
MARGGARGAALWGKSATPKNVLLFGILEIIIQIGNVP